MEDHKEHLKDEFMEALYKADEEGRLPVEESELNLTNPLDSTEIATLVDNGLVLRENGRITLTPFLASNSPNAMVLLQSPPVTAITSFIPYSRTVA